MGRVYKNKMAAESNDYPVELQSRLGNFDDSLSSIENILEKLHDVPLNDLHAKLTSLDKAKLDLVGVYAINSLFWMYLNANGENPKLHGVKTELTRIQGYMARVKEIEDKAKMARLDQSAAKRFIKSALWQQAQQKSKAAPGQATVSASATETPAKRPAQDQPDATTKKHKSSKKKHKNNSP